MAGNKNSGRGVRETPFAQALLMQIKQGDPDMKRLRRIAEKLIVAAENGESWAMTELASRLDGKPFQQTEFSGEVDIGAKDTLADLLASINGRTRSK